MNGEILGQTSGEAEQARRNQPEPGKPARLLPDIPQTWLPTAEPVDHSLHGVGTHASEDAAQGLSAHPPPCLVADHSLHAPIGEPSPPRTSLAPDGVWWRLEREMRRRQLSLSELSRELGVSRETLTNYRDGKVQSVSRKVEQRLLTYLWRHFLDMLADTPPGLPPDDSGEPNASDQR